MTRERTCTSVSATLAIASLLAGFGIGPASAQSMDYGSLEALFGEPVTTSVTGSPQRASEVPASMIIVTADEIRRSGARDIPGVLRHVPGVDVLQWTNDQADVAVRGYNQVDSARLLVLVDGRQVYADHYGYTPWATLPIELSDIRQIEIVKGPNSALFGFNAVGGVINIVTYDPLYDDVRTASILGGTQGLVQGSGTATFRFDDRAGLRVSIGGHHDDDFSTPQRLVDIGTRQGNDRKAIDLLGHARIGPDVDAAVEISHSEVSQPEYTPFYTSFYPRYRINSLKGTLVAETGLGLLQATAYGNWLRASSSAPGSTGPGYRFDNRVYVVKLRDVFKAGSDHTFRLTAEYRYNEMQTTPLAGANVHYDLYAGGAMWQWTIDPALTFTNAIRVDNLALGRNGLVPPGYGLDNADWDRHVMTAVSFNSGLVWQPDPYDTIRLTAGRGAQLPNLLDLGGLLLALPTPPGGYASGIPTLKPTTVMNYEAGWDRALPRWDAVLRLRIFHQTSRDITANSSGIGSQPPLFVTPANIGRSQATGAEISVDGTFGEAWRWGLSYTPETISDTFRPGFDAASVLVDYEHTHPVHIVNANLGWSQGPWEIDSYLRYQSSFDGIQGASAFIPSGSLIRIQDYVSVDARIALHITDGLTLAVSGQNLIDSPQIQTSAPAVERRVLASLTAIL